MKYRTFCRKIAVQNPQILQIAGKTAQIPWKSARIRKRIDLRRAPLYTQSHGTWRSLVAHSLWERGVASSNLAVPIGSAQAARAAALPPNAALGAAVLATSRAARAWERNEGRPLI